MSCHVSWVRCLRGGEPPPATGRPAHAGRMELMRTATINNVTELAPPDHGRQGLIVQLILPTDAGQPEFLQVAGLYPVPRLLAAFNVEAVHGLRGQPVIVVTDDVSGFVYGFAATGAEPALFPSGMPAE